MKKPALVVGVILAVIVVAVVMEPDDAEVIWHWLQRTWRGG